MEISVVRYVVSYWRCQYQNYSPVREGSRLRTSAILTPSSKSSWIEPQSIATSDMLLVEKGSLVFLRWTMELGAGHKPPCTLSDTLSIWYKSYNVFWLRKILRIYAWGLMKLSTCIATPNVLVGVACILPQFVLGGHHPNRLLYDKANVGQRTPQI